MMEFAMILTIVGAACLAKSLMQLFEYLEKGAKKDRAAAANNCAEVVTE